MIEKALVFWVCGMAVCLAALVADIFMYQWRERVSIHPKVSRLVISSAFWSWVGVALIVSDWLFVLSKWIVKRYNVFDEWER